MLREPLSVYLHLPWCVRKCPYCDFNSHTGATAALRGTYLDALEADIRANTGDANGRRIDTVFIGGGTPTLFSPAEIGRLLDLLRGLFAVDADAEITMEANPGTVECGSLAAYRGAGVNRLSLGAQSFDERSLQQLGRLHSVGDIRASFDEARTAGFDNVNLDLMFALPGQTADAALRDLEAAIALEPEHVSWYQLTLEPNTVFYARPPADLPDDDLAADMQAAGTSLLETAGYARYEVSAFARDGRNCRHNLNYWRFGDYLGFGAGAHGKVTRRDGTIWLTRRAAHPRQYVQLWTTGEGDRGRQRLTAAELPFEFMLNALRLAAGFTLSRFEAATGLSRAAIEPRLRALEARGMLASGSGDAWQPTRRGYLFLNDLQAEFLPDDAVAGGAAS
ncbi:MAG: radical SAM family heme chaperone HemW [Woeseiaceae bacterium]|nr:radical SAM family heme chaperone HemW [Woeseiaceae bacterium]